MNPSPTPRSGKTPRTDALIAELRAKTDRGETWGTLDMEAMWKLARELEVREKTVTEAMVNRFLSWPLPASVCSDLCVTRTDYPHSRIGTNLLTADEARQMLEHVLAAPFVASETKRKLTDEEVRQWAARHDISGQVSELRNLIEDARSL